MGYLILDNLYIINCLLGYVFAGHNTHSFQDILKTNFQFWFDMKVVQNFNEIFAPVAAVEICTICWPKNLLL